MGGRKAKATARALQLPIPKTVKTEMASLKIAFIILTE